MRAGRLNKKIDIQRKTITQDNYGQEIESWSNISARRSASVSPVKAEERYTADQFVARQQLEFVCKKSDNIATLNPLDRIIHPAIDADASPQDVITDDRVFDIMAVFELGRGEGFRILAARRPEQ